MHSTFANGIAACCVAVLSLFAGAGGYDAVVTLSAPPAPRNIHLVKLVYENGKIGQDLIVSGAEFVPAKWTAIIQRPGHVGSLCGGSGEWPYKARAAGEAKFFTPSEWTEDQCPPLQEGDELSVAYEYKTSNGFVAVTGGSLKLTKEMLK